MFNFVLIVQVGTLGQTNSLKSLRISTYPHIEDFNIPKAIFGLENLRSLWIEAPVAPHTSPTSHLNNKTPPKAVVATDLRKEMAGLLPHKLRKITVGGKGYTLVSELLLRVNRKR